MIKVAAKDNFGRPILFLGLSRRNCEKLLADPMDDHIPIEVDEVMPGAGAGLRIILFAGENEEQMVAEMRERGVTMPPARWKE